MTAAPLHVSGVSKSYDKNLVLDDVSFDLAPGEIFGLIGLNGVGKTTLIKVLLNLITADLGQAEIFGVNCLDPKARRHLMYLPEKFQPSRHLRGHEFLQLALSYYGLLYDKAVAEALAAQLDLEPTKLQNKIGSYSKGMGQKLGLISAFLGGAPLLVLDEPMSGLDPRARIQLKRLLKECRAQGKTIFFSSHILSDIDEICDRIGVLHGTKMRFVGTPSDFKKNYPASSLEQSFLAAIDEDNKAIAA